jgi:cytochrome c2
VRGSGAPWLAALAAACASAPERGGGEDLFEEPREPIGGPHNLLACADCHTIGGAAADDRIRPGGDLGGVAARGSWWNPGDEAPNGPIDDLAAAISFCRTLYMRAPVAADDRHSERLAAWLADNAPGPADPVIVPARPDEKAIPVARGDAAAGEALWQRACAWCHGDVHAEPACWKTARPGPVEQATPMCGGLVHEGYPIDPNPGDPDYAPFPARFRHYFDQARDPKPLYIATRDLTSKKGMTMPFFLPSILSDADLADVLEYQCSLDPACVAEADTLAPRPE